MQYLDEDGFELVSFNRDPKNVTLRKKKTFDQLQDEVKVHSIKENLLKFQQEEQLVVIREVKQEVITPQNPIQQKAGGKMGGRSKSSLASSKAPIKSIGKANKEKSKHLRARTRRGAD